MNSLTWRHHGDFRYIDFNELRARWRIEGGERIALFINYEPRMRSWAEYDIEVAWNGKETPNLKTIYGKVHEILYQEWPSLRERGITLLAAPTDRAFL